MKFIKVIKADEKEQRYWEHPNYENWKNQKAVAEEQVTQDAFEHLPDLYNLINQKIGMQLKFNADIVDRKGEKYIKFESEDFSKDSNLLSIIFKELTLSTFNSSAATESKPDTSRDYDVTTDPKAFYWLTVHFSFKIHAGGFNGIEFCTAWYKDGKWTIKFDSDRKSNW